MNMKHSVFLLACFLCLWCIKHEFSQEKVDPGWHPIWASDSLHTVYPSHITRYIPLRRWHIQGWAWQRCSGKEHRLVRREAHHPQRSPAVLTQCGGQDCWCPSPHLAFEDRVLPWIYWVALSKTVDVFVMKCPHKHGFELSMMGECKVWDLQCQDCWCPSPHLAFEDGVLRCCTWSGISHGFSELRYLKQLMFLSWNVRTSMDLSWTWWVNVRCEIWSKK